MTMGVRFPFRRRKSRWERLRERMEKQRAAATRRLPDTELRRRVQPLVERAAAVRPELSLPETPAFLHDGLHLDRLSIPGRRQPSRVERVLGAESSLWLVLAAALGGVMVGYLLGSAAAQRQRVGPEELEAAADQIKHVWPSIHDEDIREAKGNLKRLSTVIGERTGESTRVVREQLASLTARRHSSNGGSAE